MKVSPITHGSEASTKVLSGLPPDAHLSLENGRDRIAARCALWWSQTPWDPGDPSRRIGVIGQFEFDGVEAGVRLLERACSRLRENGCRRAVGPMDGDTWHRYRLVTGGWENADRFFLEPWNDQQPIDAFTGAGFGAWVRYSSSEVPLARPDGKQDAALRRLEARVADRGIGIRSLHIENFESELAHLFALSELAFRDNFLYSPIDRAAFQALYAPIEGLIDPEFVLLAEREGEVLGFVFAMPDRLRSEGDRLVVKTLAVHPRGRQMGLGTVLVHRVQEAARRRGFGSAIHALQFEDNRSLKITRRQSGRMIREYTLFQRELAETR